MSNAFATCVFVSWNFAAFFCAVATTVIHNNEKKKKHFLITVICFKDKGFAEDGKWRMVNSE